MSEIIVRFVFWTAMALLFYTYAGYGLLLMLLLRFRRRSIGEPSPADTGQSHIDVVVCAFNEAGILESKLNNTCSLDYPHGKMHLVVVTDGSYDGTDLVAGSFNPPAGMRYTHLHQPVRQGKIAAFHRAMEVSSSPIVVSSDANTMLNREALKLLVAPFNNPSIGAVAGEKRIVVADRDDASASGEGLYWRYESALKRMDANLWSVVGAAGELFAFRREAFEVVPEDTIIEDFFLSMRIAQKGWRVAYEPNAVAIETASASVSEELKRKVRIAAGGWQAMSRLLPLLNVFRYGTLSFQYISHRVLRWTLAPTALPVLYFSNLWLAWSLGGGWILFFVLQTLFYFAAVAGRLLEKKSIKMKMLFVPYYFCIMNYAAIAGFVRWIRGRQSVLWERAERR
ncbi:MAG: glycosyltransferase family 2 protein [Saprospiraceae bacterium]|nr:glycosyltransferase family 2 protein [Saprospiraceae bacterium]